MLSMLALSLAVAVQTPPPPPYPRIRLYEYVPAMEPSYRSFEEARAFVLMNGEDDLSVTAPQVEMTAREDMARRTSLSLAFNWIWLATDEGRRPVWFVRLRAMNMEGTIERFADARLCPGVEESLQQLADLPAVQPRVPRLPSRGTSADMTDFGPLYMHDNSYGVRLRGLSAGGVYSDRLQLNGGSDARFAPVIADSLTRLKPCWTATPPPRA